MNPRVRKLVGALLILVVLEGALFTVFYTRFHRVGYNGDALYDAQVARNVLAGRGYRTNELPLYAVNLYESAGIPLAPPWFNAHKFPLPVFVKAALFTLVGESVFTATYLYSLVFHLFALGTIFFLAYRIFGSVPRAFLAGIVFLSHPALFYGTRFVAAGLNLTADTFFFLLLLGCLVWWLRRRRLVAVFVMGAVIGLAFLNRFNAGLYLPALALWFVAVRWREAGRESIMSRATLRELGLPVLGVGIGFLAVVAPFFVYTFREFGAAPISINGLFQLLFETRFNSGIDPWYKLEYVFPTDNPLGFALRYPAELLVKWGYHATMTVLRFFTFERTWWWMPLAALFFIRKTDPRERTTLTALLGFTGIVFAMQAAILPFWSGNIVYAFFLFAAFPLVFPAVLAPLTQSATRLRERAPEFIRQSFRDIAARSRVGAAFRSAGIALLTLISLGALLLAAFFPVFRAFAEGSAIFAAGGIVVGIVLVALLLWFTPRLGIAVLLVAMVISPLSRGGAFSRLHEAETLARQWDFEDTPRDLATLQNVQNGGIVLSLAPWNVVWFAPGLASLPLPEYPDEIYLLESRYRQRIDSLYVKKLGRYPAELAPYTWQAYRRMEEFGVAPAGYRFLERVNEGFIAERLPTGLVRESFDIDAGSADAVSHLIWGWGKDERRGDRSFVWATKAKIPDAAAQPRPIAIAATRGMASFVMPDAEITFLVDARIPTELAVTVSSPVPEQSLEAVLNGNLFAFGTPGRYLGKATLREGSQWTTVTFPLPAGSVRVGLNKLSFRFSGQDIQGRAMAFDRIELRTAQ